MIQEIKLSDKISIYKTNYNWEYSQESFVERANQVENFKLRNNIILYFLFDCLEFRSINTFVLNCCKEISKKDPKEWAIKNWVWIARGASEFDKEVREGKHDYNWHTHTTTYDNFEQIITDWTFCFYIQMPDNLEDTEGNVAFKTEDNKTHFFLPKEGEVFFFPGNVVHSTIGFMTDKNKDRVLIAGNISLDPLRVFKKNKLV